MTVDECADGWPCRLNAPSKAVADVAMPADAVKAASDVSSAFALEIQTGIDSQDNSRESFQFGAECESLGSGREPNSFY